MASDLSAWAANRIGSTVFRKHGLARVHGKNGKGIPKREPWPIHHVRKAKMLFDDADSFTRKAVRKYSVRPMRCAAWYCMPLLRRKARWTQYNADQATYFGGSEPTHHQHSASPCYKPPSSRTPAHETTPN